MCKNTAAMSNNINNNNNERDHNRDDDHVLIDVDDDQIDIEEYNLQTATDSLFEIVHLGEDVSPRDEQLAIRLLQQFLDAAQTVSADHGGRGREILLHATCGNDSPEALI